MYVNSTKHTEVGRISLVRVHVVLDARPGI